MPFFGKKDKRADQTADGAMSPGGQRPEDAELREQRRDEQADERMIAGGRRFDQAADERLRDLLKPPAEKGNRYATDAVVEIDRLLSSEPLPGDQQETPPPGFEQE